MVTVSIGTGSGARRGKRRAQGGQTSYARLAKARKMGQARAHYTTVARTRGVFGTPGEMKYFDSELSAKSLVVGADWTGTEFDPDTVPVASINCLFAPKQGSNIDERIGRNVKVHKLKVRGMITVTEQTGVTAADGAAYIRIVLVQDTQTNGLQMQGEQVFTDPVTASGNMAQLSFQSLENLGRFKVLKDIKLLMGNPNLGVGSTNVTNIQQGMVAKFSFNISWRDPLIVHFSQLAAGKVGDIVDHSFHILCNTNNIDLVPQMTYYCRTSFKE